MRTRILNTCVACCAALSLFAVGCEKSKSNGGSGGESGDQSSDEGGGETRQGDPPIEKEKYVDAAFALNCVDREIGDEVDMEGVEEDVFSEYEIDKKETFQKARDYFAKPKKKEEGDEDEDEKTDVEKEIAERMEEACTTARARMIAGQAPIEKKTYVDATFRLSCIDEELGDDIEMEKAEKHVYDAQDLDEDTYTMAEEFFSDKEGVNDEIKSRMEDECTKARARIYAGLSKPGPAYTGSLQGSASGQGGFGTAKLKLTISDDYSVFGNFQGTREGKGFRIPLEGKISKNDNLSVQGSSGQNSVSISGKVSSGGSANTSLSGSIFGRDVSLSIRAN